MEFNTDTKLNIYLFQLTESYELNKYFFPYSVAIIQSYCQTIPFIDDNCVFKDLIFKIDEDFDKFIELNIKNPSVIGFSNYIWNNNRHLKLMEKIKNKFSNVVSVVGGPSFPNLNYDETVEFFYENPCLDIGVYGEGEKVFADILKKCITKQPIDNVPGIFHRKKNGPRKEQIIKNTASPRISNLDEIPSPYLNGIYDNLKQKHEKIEFYAIIETDRGCPFKCTFCDWGSLTHQKMKTFDIQRVYDELDFMSNNKIEILHFTNSNLGIFKERDYNIIDYLCNLYEQTGFPKEINEAGYSKTPITKNSNVEIKKRLKNTLGELYHTPRISLQTLNQEILKNIKRKDFYEEDLENLLYENYLSEIEYVFPMPGHSYEIFIDDLTQLLKYKNVITNVFPCIMLPNAPMNEISYREKFGLRTKLIDSEAGEQIKLITSTKNLTFEECKKSWMFLWILNSFYKLNDLRNHFNQRENILTFDISKKVDSMLNEISYKDFFVKLQNYFEEEMTFTSLYYHKIKSQLYVSSYRFFIDYINNPQHSFDKFFLKNEKTIRKDLDNYFRYNF